MRKADVRQEEMFVTGGWKREGIRAILREEGGEEPGG
jgi:hypothetical protein